MTQRLLVLSWVLAACQPVEFQRVTPMAAAQTRQRTIVATRLLKPNVMLLLDTSGSMLLPIDPASPGCAPGCGTSAASPCAAGCPTRSSEVKASLDGFLAASVAHARVGLTTYPADVQCAPPTAERIPLPPPSTDDAAQLSLLQDQALQARAVVQAVQPAGGTPTAAALQYVGQLPGLRDTADGRDDFVVLLTDGLPNCNDAHPAQLCGGSPTPAQQQACACTLSSCAGPVCSRGCLDEGAALAAVQALRADGIRTVVVGFGAELASGDAPRVLTGLAHAGGFERPGTAFYPAANANELVEALTGVLDSFETPCEYLLAARPSAPELISVSVDGADVQPGAETWRYDAQRNRVLFTGPVCTRLEASTSLTPVSLEFRILEVL